MSKLLKPWICSFIQQKQQSSARFCKAAVVFLNKGFTKNGWHIKEITDGSVYIQALFTNKAVDKCLGDTGTHEDLNSAILLLRDIRIELQQNIANDPEFVLVVEDFVIWDHQRGFKLSKTSITPCMEDNRVQEAVKQYVKTHRQPQIVTEMGDNSESQSLSVLLQEMAEASAECDTSIPAQRTSETTSTEEDLLVKLTRPFNVKEFILPSETDNILKGLKEWDGDYRIPATASGDGMVLQSPSIQDYSMGGLNTMAEQIDSQSEGIHDKHKEPRHEANRDMSEMVHKQPDSEKLHPSETSVGYNQSQSERSCWQDCMDSVQLSDESLDIGQPDAHSTQVDKDIRSPVEKKIRGQVDKEIRSQVDKESRSQDFISKQIPKPTDGAITNRRYDRDSNKSIQQSSSVEIIEQNNSVILISSGSDESYRILTKKSSNKIKQHDQAELERLGALSVTRTSVSESSHGEFSQSELYRNSVLDKHLNCGQTNETEKTKNRGSEDLFKDSTSTEEHSGRSCDKGVSEIDQQDTRQNISSFNDSDGSRNLLEYSSNSENKENENSQTDNDKEENSQEVTTHINVKMNFNNIVTGGSSLTALQKLQLCRDLCGKKNSVHKARSSDKAQSTVNAQLTNTVKPSQSSSESNSSVAESDSGRISSDVSIMWKYYAEGSPVRSRNSRYKISRYDKVNKCDKVNKHDQNETKENAAVENNRQEAYASIQSKYPTVNPHQFDGKKDSDQQNDSLSLYTNYKFTETDHHIHTQESEDINREQSVDKEQYMSSLELSPVEVCSESENISVDVDEVTATTNKVKPTNNGQGCTATNSKLMVKSRINQSSNTNISQNSDADTLYARVVSRPCSVVLERLTEDILDSWKCRKMSEQNIKKNHKDGTSYSPVIHENKRTLCYRNNSVKTCKTGLPITKSRLGRNDKRNQTELSSQLEDFNSMSCDRHNKSNAREALHLEKENDTVTNHSIYGAQPLISALDKEKDMGVNNTMSGTQPFISVVVESQGFVPMSPDRELVYLGPALSNCDEDSFDFKSNDVIVDSVKDGQEIVAMDKDSGSGHFQNKQKNRNTSIERIKLSRKKHAQKLGIDIDRLSNKSGSKKQEEGKELDISLNGGIENAIDSNIKQCVGKVEPKTCERVGETDKISRLDNIDIVIPRNVHENEFTELSLLQDPVVMPDTQAECTVPRSRDKTDIIETQNVQPTNQNAESKLKETHGQQSISLSNSTAQAKVGEIIPSIIESLQHDQDLSPEPQTDYSLHKVTEKVDKNDNELMGNEEYNFVENVIEDEIISDADSFESTRIPFCCESTEESVVNETKTKSNIHNEISIPSSHENQKAERETKENKTNLILNETYTIPINGKKEKLSVKYKKTVMYVEKGPETNLVTNDSSTISLNGIDSLTDHKHKRKRNRSIIDDQETTLVREGYANKRVCLEMSRPGTTFSCSDAEMDYLLHKCPSKSELLGCVMGRFIPSNESNLVTLFPVIKVLDIDYKLKPVNKKWEKECDSNDLFSIPLKKIKRKHRRTIIIPSEPEENVSDTNSDGKSEYEDSLFGFMQVSKASKIQQSTCTYSKKFKKHLFENQSALVCTKSDTQVFQEPVAGPSTSTDMEKPSNRTDISDMPSTTGNQITGVERNRLRLTMDKTTGACRFSRVPPLTHSNDNLVQFHKEPDNSSISKGKGPAKSNKHSSKGKQRSNELCSFYTNKMDKTEKHRELNVKKKNNTVALKDNKEVGAVDELNRSVAAGSEETDHNQCSNSVVPVEKKKETCTKNKQKGTVKRQRNTDSDELSGKNESIMKKDHDINSKQTINDNENDDELQQRSLRKRKSNVLPLTKESLKTHTKSHVDKVMFLQKWLKTSNLGVANEDDD